jgi:hypothetical protein
MIIKISNKEICVNPVFPFSIAELLRRMKICVRKNSVNQCRIRKMKNEPNFKVLTAENAKNAEKIIIRK